MQTSRTSLSVLLLMVCATNAFAQAKPPIQLVSKPPSTPQGMEGGLWRTDQDFESVLYLKNVLINQSITATPTIYMADGTPFALAPITLDPAGVATININRALQALPPALQGHTSTFGMVGVSYQWSWAAAMLATVRNVDEVAMVSFESSLASDINVAHGAASSPPAQQQEALWWKTTADSSGFVVLSNSLLTPLPVQLTANDNQGVKKGSKHILLQPHASQWIALTEVLGAEPKVGDAGSMIATYAGPDNSLLINAGMQDNTTGYSATLHFRERHPELAWNPSEHTVILDAPGIMYGPQNPKMQFPENTAFAPYGVLHNLSSKDRQVAVSLTYAGAGGPETHTLPSVTVPANTTQIVDVPKLMSAANLAPATTSIDLSYAFTGNEFDLEMEQGSVDQSMNYVFSVPAHKEDWTIGRTICHWNLQGDNNTMISLWNYTTQPEDLKLTLYYRGGQYQVPIHIEPRADYELDIASLVHSQAPDANGAVIPTSITEGSALLTDAKGEGTRINVASNTAEFNVRNATCGTTCVTCNGVTQASLITQPFALGLYQTMQSSAQMTYNTGSTSQTTSGTWSSYGSAVTVNQSGLLTGASYGSNNVGVTIAGQPVGAGYICNPNGACPPPQTFGPSAPAQTKPDVTLSGPTQLPLSGSGSNPVITFTANGTPSGGTYSWTASNSDVTLSTTSGSSIAVAGVSAGTVNIDVQYIVNGASDSDDQNVTVQQPSSLPVISNAQNSKVLCGSGAGWVRNVNRQLSDQLGAAISEGNELIVESLSSTNPDGLAIGNASPANKETSANGQVTDLFQFCNASCAASNPATSKLTQTLNDGKFPLGQYTVVYSCTGITINGN